MILDRYILGRFTTVFLFAVAVFTLLFVAADLSTLLHHDGLHGEKAVTSYTACRALQYAVMTFPMACLLAALLVFGNLAEHGEIIALMAAGVSFPRMARPAISFCLLVSLLSGLAHRELIPRSLLAANHLLLAEGLGKEIILSPGPHALPDGLELVLTAHSYDPATRQLKGVFLSYFMEGRRVREVYADDAHWDGEGWSLKSMRSVQFDRSMDISWEVKADSVWTRMPSWDAPPGPGQLTQRPKLLEEMTSQELAFLEAGKSGLQTRRAVVTQERWALSLACLVLGLVGIVLSHRNSKSSNAQGFALCLGLSLGYYFLMTYCSWLGNLGSLAPLAAAWLPNLLIGLIAVAIFLYRADR